ncbi:MAG TPA: aminotransferase class I/II-fold pyridoxal phosphate-dependent enzyme [Candidatus Baltobacteraceae bacterium]|nr:aminotransferase class I/II-fold pyridoxal phosphate-dependent enzyme [Candidatus Baltobacteraceae bacterium]
MSVVHGGDLHAVARRHGVDAATLVDFSANIAPDGPPPGVTRVLAQAAIAPRMLAPYPSRSYAPLRAQIASALEVGPEAVVLGHGSAALIDIAVRTAGASEWLVPVPAFSEYERALRAAGARLVPFSLPANLELDVAEFTRSLQARPRAGALVNTPHNPSGSALQRGEALALLRNCREMQRPLVVDEAFVEYAPERSIVRDAVCSGHAIVLRSLTKFYALAGVRIGYALAHPDLAHAMRERSPSWPVGTLDEAIALEALRDERYAVRTRENNTRAREDLARDLRALGLRVFPSVANFLLIELPVAPRHLEVALRALIEDGIVVRDCRSYAGLEHGTAIRVAVLDRAQNQRLVNSIAKVRPGIG